MATHSVFLPGEFHEQKSLAGYSPWGRKESDTTKQLTVLQYALHKVKYALHTLSSVYSPASFDQSIQSCNHHNGEPHLYLMLSPLPEPKLSA